MLARLEASTVLEMNIQSLRSCVFIRKTIRNWLLIKKKKKKKCTNYINIPGVLQAEGKQGGGTLRDGV